MVHPAVLLSSVMQGYNFHFNFREEGVYGELLELQQLQSALMRTGCS